MCMCTRTVCAHVDCWSCAMAEGGPEPRREEHLTRHVVLWCPCLCPADLNLLPATRSAKCIRY